MGLKRNCRCFCCCFWHSVMSDPLGPHGLWPCRLLCPWDSPGKDTGVGCHFLLQGIFLVQGSNPCLLHWQMDSLPLSHQGSPPNSRLPQSHSRKTQPCGLMTSLFQLITQRKFSGNHITIHHPESNRLWTLTSLQPCQTLLT